MANNSSGVYDGLPFSYLTNTSPTDKQPPRSPRLSARSQSAQERGEPVGEAQPPQEDAAEELRPFTYLTPNSPTERDLPSGAPEIIGEEQGPSGSRDLYNNPSFASSHGHDNSRRLPREGEVYPAGAGPQDIRVGSDPNYYTSMKDTDDRQWDHDRSRSAAGHPQDRSRGDYHLGPDYRGGGQAAPSTNYELGDYSSIPRPKVGGGVSEETGYSNYRKDYQNGNNNRGYDNMAAYQQQQKPRPLSRDSYLDSGIKRGQGCECRIVLMAIILIVLALGAGFAAGWFVSKSVNSSSDSNTIQGDSSAGASTSPLMAALTSTSTTTTARSASTIVSTAVSTIPTTTTQPVTTTRSQPATVPTTTTSDEITTTTETDPPSTAPDTTTTQTLTTTAAK